MAKEEFLWSEKYRPETVEDCILPKKIKEVCQGIVDAKNIPNLLLFGSPGTGKTTVAKVLVKQLDFDSMFLNGSLGADESGIEAVRTKIRTFASAKSFSGKRKVVIIDEADYLNPNSSQPAMRSLIEEFSKNTAYIFTANQKNKIIAPIQSRCSVIEFKIDRAERAELSGEYFNRLIHILESENVKVSDKKVLANVLMNHFPDFRRCLNEIQKYVVGSGGVVDEGILGSVITNQINSDKLWGYIRARNFNECRKWVVDSLVEDPRKIYRMIYDTSTNVLTQQSLPPLIEIIEEYLYRCAFDSDQEINIMAFLVNVMADDRIVFLED